MDNPVLFAKVKRKLQITWDDDDTTARIEEIMESVTPDLIHRLGITDPEYDFNTPGTEQTLFLAACLYEWNHATDEFAVNYAEVIAQCRTRHEVEYYRTISEDVANGED